MPTPPPLFIVGVGRSGSTMLMDLLREHRRIAWLSPVARGFPANAQLNQLVLRAVDLPLVGPRLRERFGPREAYGFWEALAPGFRRPPRDLLATDVTAASRQALRDGVDTVRTGARPHFVGKLTGWPRVGYLHEVFPEARFVHLVRDGRAVAASYLRIPEEQRWGSPEAESWRYGPLPERYRTRWEASGRSPVALSALLWMMMLDAFDARAAELPRDACLEVSYEDLCREPAPTIARILAHGHIPPSAELAAEIRRQTLDDQNRKWRGDLTDAQQALMTELLRDHLVARGYAP